ncbi:MAG: hypothetical protein OET79_15325, partial [Nitrospirota bacterium]|nr:hypothetical protein [Nitrospirota bacterium]
RARPSNNAHGLPIRAAWQNRVLVGWSPSASRSLHPPLKVAGAMIVTQPPGQATDVIRDGYGASRAPSKTSRTGSKVWQACTAPVIVVVPPPSRRSP